ncbi:VWA domain-containing protein [Thioalkalivibrio sp. ALE30]|uniref:VWA domain-containing protein n=1 Tax=Thioalkalivibrio sp. ALE30 TaxID=1158181 RepID=UPI0003614F48|nr:VWA domain-containing protein [Thioalkalivibrio sp. ALE30]
MPDIAPATTRTDGETQIMTPRLEKPHLLGVTLLATAIGLMGCGGGGSDSSSGGSSGGDTSDARITLTPDRFDFGLITEGNLDEIPPRKVVIGNEGTTSYNIADISVRLDSQAAFRLIDSDGSDRCQARPFALAPGDQCSVAVEFQPRQFGEFEAALIVQSDDPANPSVGGTLKGAYRPIESINVTVNQINACPRSDDAQAFVSVTDQAGFPIPDLHQSDFSLAGFPIDSVEPVGPSLTDLALGIVMDYSGSITNLPSAVANMEEGATLLVDAMKDGDEADIIKYAQDVQLMTPDGFTSDKDVLKAAIEEEPTAIGRGTAFYDATVEAIERMEAREERRERKTIIALTDGQDNASSQELPDAIVAALATDVPVFTVGFGDVNEDELGELARETGGLFYNPAGDANLQQVFKQLARILFDEQYLIYFTPPTSDEASSLEVTLEFERLGSAFRGTGGKTIQACP